MDKQKLEDALFAAVNHFIHLMYATIFSAGVCYLFWVAWPLMVPLTILFLIFFVWEYRKL